MAEAMIRTGRDTIAAMFVRAKQENRAAFLPYFPIGYPDYPTSVEAIAEMAAAGVDGFEIGVPFSDPLADGPTLQAATQRALANGTTVRTCLQAVKELRARGVQQPMLLMSYLNPLLAYGPDALVRDAKAVGVDGLIIPDLPPEEAAIFSETCEQEGLALVFFLAPTSNPQRIALAAERATGFIYVVALTGVTGARKELSSHLVNFIRGVREQTSKPLVLGFGISTPEHVRVITPMVDGFIVASALIVEAEKRGMEAMQAVASRLRRALEQD